MLFGFTHVLGDKLADIVGKFELYFMVPDLPLKIAHCI